jgi:hypothetical protein
VLWPQADFLTVNSRSQDSFQNAHPSRMVDFLQPGRLLFNISRVLKKTMDGLFQYPNKATILTATNDNRQFKRYGENRKAILWRKSIR